MMVCLYSSRWSRREEADFYRVVSTFGVERDRSSKQYQWDTFRNLARLDKKFGDTLTEYFLGFYHMCKRVCKRFTTPEEGKGILQHKQLNNHSDENHLLIYGFHNLKIKVNK